MILNFKMNPILLVSVAQPCTDKDSSCVSKMTETATLCTDNPVYAQQMCYYSCGLCNQDASKCWIHFYSKRKPFVWSLSNGVNACIYFIRSTSLQARSADLPASPAGLLGRFALASQLIYPHQQDLWRSVKGLHIFWLLILISHPSQLRSKGTMS